MKIASSIVAGFLAGFLLVACTGDSDAGSDSPPTGNSGETVSKAEFDALQLRVNQLETALEVLSRNVNVVVARNGSATATTMKATMPADYATRTQKLAAIAQNGEAVNCAESGFLPDAMTGTVIECKTPAGYLYRVKWPQGGPVLPPQFMYFEGAGCTGKGWTHPEAVADGARAQGAIFSYVNGVGERSFIMIPAGSPASGAATVTSVHGTNDGCSDIPPRSLTGLIAVEAHDPTITQGENEYPPLAIQ